LGCVLYRCLTGEVPFRRDSELVTIYAHLEDPPPRPSDVRRDLPPAVDRVIERALAKSRRERYPTCMELADAAERALGSTSSASALEQGSRPLPPPAQETSTGATQRGTTVLRYAGIVAGAVLLVVLGVLLAGSRNSPRPSRSPGVTGSTGSTGSSGPLGDGGPYVVAAAGEIACANPPPPATDLDHCRYDETARLVRPGNLVAVLALGDNQYESGSYADYSTYYDPSWGQARRITEPVPGDREYNQGASSVPAGYVEYFGERVMGTRGFGYYNFNLPDNCVPRDDPCWHFIALNSELCLLSGGCGPTPAGVTPGPGNTMYRWLKHDLATHPNKKYPCTLAFWHHPLFSFSTATAPTTAVQPLWDLLYAAHADVVLNADAHNYQRWEPMNPQGLVDRRHGIREFIVGTGGARKDSLASGVWPSQLAAAQDTTFGVLQITLDETGYTWKWVTAAGQPPFSDSVATPVDCA
jgi:hypothetical protein